MEKEHAALFAKFELICAESADHLQVQHTK